ncbi:MAG TPA: serine hydrolase domain-containing protein [Gemmatimonadaceae bacterium]|nr:serine hydrolase domain-containing protein [Gemmatimonadaceae bacterium]
MRTYRPLSVVVALVVSASAAVAQNATDRFAAVRDTINAILAAGAHASISVAVARNDSILWQEGFGFANREKQIRATAQTMYSLASISKPFTATAIMVLAQRGKIDIERPANDYLGSAKLVAHEGTANEMTVRRILSHTAGLPLHYQFFYEGGPKLHSDDIAITKYGFAGYKPGETYLYSNLGFGILGYIAGRVGGSNYETFLKNEVLGPLRLSNTTVSTGAGLGDRAAIRYDAQRNPIPPYAFDHTGASGVWSSANDLVRFGMFHANLGAPSSVLSPTTRERMQRVEAPETAPGSSYGLGWGLLENDRGYRRVSHTGGMPGVTTVLNLYPSERVVIVVLANTAGAPIGRVANMLASIVLPNYVLGPVTAPPAPPPAPKLGGVWRGSILVDGTSIPLTLNLADSGASYSRLGSSDSVRIAQGGYNARTGWMNVLIAGSIRAPDATPANDTSGVRIQVSMRLHGDKLSGWATALSPGPIAYGAVSYWAEVRR